MDIRATSALTSNPYQNQLRSPPGLEAQPEATRTQSAAKVSQAAVLANGDPGAALTQGASRTQAMAQAAPPTQGTSTETFLQTAQPGRDAVNRSTPPEQPQGAPNGVNPQAVAAQVAYQFQTSSDPSSQAALDQQAQVGAQQALAAQALNLLV